MKCLENVGLLRTDTINFNGQEIVPIQFLKALLPDPASLGPRTLVKPISVVSLQVLKMVLKKPSTSTMSATIKNATQKLVHKQFLTRQAFQHDWDKIGYERYLEQAGVYNLEELDPDPFMEALMSMVCHGLWLKIHKWWTDEVRTSTNTSLCRLT